MERRVVREWLAVEAGSSEASAAALGCPDQQPAVESSEILAIRRQHSPGRAPPSDDAAGADGVGA